MVHGMRGHQWEIYGALKTKVEMEPKRVPACAQLALRAGGELSHQKFLEKLHRLHELLHFTDLITYQQSPRWSIDLNKKNEKLISHFIHPSLRCS